MRRKEKEMTDPDAIRRVIEQASVCRLAMIADDGPYIVPLCFGYRANTLYFHSAAKGRKIDLLRNDSRVCFEFEAASQAIEAEKACDWAMRYCSVIGFGNAIFLEDPTEKRRALDTIMAHYSDRSFTYPDGMLAATTVFTVKIVRMTGKQSGFA